jgi:hypothetical protein
MNRKILSKLTLILIGFTLSFAIVLAGCGTSSVLKGTVADKTYNDKDLNNFASITKGFSGDDFDYTKENTKSYDNWLGYMTDDLKKQMKITIPSRIKNDKTNETIETFEKVEIKTVKKQVKDKKTYAVVNFNVYENVKHNIDSSKNGKETKVSGDIYLLKVGNDYKIDAFDYGKSSIVASNTKAPAITNKSINKTKK